MPRIGAFNFYAFIEGESRGFLWTYKNQQGKYGMYLVAAVNIHSEKPFDWSCYMGVSEAGAQREEDGWREAYLQGCKVSKEIAVAAFPQFADIPYRY